MKQQGSECGTTTPSSELRILAYPESSLHFPFLCQGLLNIFSEDKLSSSVCVYICVCINEIYICMYIYMYVYVCICICTFICMFIYIYI